ncbi:hypothetical protein DAPPUDRAFT_114926 [Daphnia pulex]|uniref:Uncharacterized protein n=1 Tax=Daphnia pulex TaxID=6669 RepID=E9HJQ9_DAPPU|nr:hypothetical protein DAPPUDRAFT_114926 [Daphnia pulex]|eukprot:EFX68026.1 hypothetical protein DAPPUDRAFT_114926 [Daphnia pulex]
MDRPRKQPKGSSQKNSQREEREKSRAEQSRAEQSRAEQSRAEQREQMDRRPSVKRGKNAIHLRNCEIVQQQQQQEKEQQEKEELFCASCWTFDRSPSSPKRGEAAEEKERQDGRTRSFEIEQQQQSAGHMTAAEK